MTDIEPFWRQYWNAVDRSPPTFPALRQCATEAIRSHDSLFPITWAAHMLLSTNYTISVKQKLACLAVLEACCPPQRRESPFFRMLLIDALELLQQQLVKDSIEEENEWVISCLYELIESFLPEILEPEQFAALQTAVQQKAVTEEIRKFLDEALRPFIISRDSYVNPLLLFSPEQNKAAELAKLLSTDESKDEETTPSVRAADLLQPFKSLEIPFARPLPPPLPPVCGFNDEIYHHDEEKLHAELIWITPSNLRLMLLPLDDTHDASRESRFQQVLDLMRNKAFLKPLAPNEQRLIMEVLNEDGSTKKDPPVDSERLVRECGLNPQNLHRLVENNPMVAHECLLRILRPSSDSYSEDDKNEYLSSLVSMDMSLHTMEVVNRLATHANSNPGSSSLLHPEYIHLFIGSCIASCENIPDQHAQNRLVRLVCVFVQSLLRNQIVQVEDIYVVMESFCIEFSRIREAAALFKMLRSSGG
ncbi:hypothetical protein FisN_6Hh245 [Fistulifera solaris]|uniref:CCR4-NOT transcription complex subunit 11 n=1 Tax=Fistulifera solaris TaxID=1519565 RepID=A0A1Z5K1Y1_FISSO|nr:hypothetical protein FisN_6Hh245 [Fistulifera solaris]|eukprot:GAX20294.1 hypothetical protein FisN_6Hh245 [Fistulifera solaris]